MAKMIQYTSKYNLFKRLLVCPLVFLIIILVSAVQAIRAWIMFIRFGGEQLIYKSDDVATLDKIWEELKRKEASNG